MYEKGVFKPLENVELKEGVKGKVRIEEGDEGFEDFERFFGIFKGKEIHIDEERDEIVEREGKNKEEMTGEIEAVYEKGVLKPLERLDLREGERVKVEIQRHERERVLKRYVGRIKLDRDVKLRDILYRV